MDKDGLMLGSVGLLLIFLGVGTFSTAPILGAMLITLGIGGFATAYVNTEE